MHATKCSTVTMGFGSQRLQQLAVLLVAMTMLSACKWRTGDEKQYSSVDTAVAAGALDRRIVDELRKSGMVRVLVTQQYVLPPIKIYPERRVMTQQEEWLNARRQELRLLKEALMKRHPGLETVATFDSFPIQFLQINREELLLGLLNDKVVMSVAPDMASDYLLAESLPLIRATNARAARARGAGVGVALIDSGVKTTNLAFGTCPAAGASGCSVVLSEDIGQDDGELDNVGHGTNMAATILAVAPSASLVVFDAGEGANPVRDSNAIAALNRILVVRAQFNIRAVNMSFGHNLGAWTGFCSGRDPYVPAFAMLRSVGIVPVVASGNNGRSATAYVDGIDRPACMPGAVSVGAVYDSSTASKVHANCTDTAALVDMVPCFSQSGPNLTVLAPGADIDVLLSTGLAGTSLSAAFVSGSVATLTAFRPALTVAQIESLLTTNGPAILDTRNAVTRRRLDVLGMLDAAAAPTPDLFANAKVIVGGVASAEASNFIASKEPGEPNHAGVAGGASLWFQWTSPYTGPAKIMTAGTNFDHVIAVYTGTAVNALTAVASDKPPIPPTPIPQPASVTFNATAGTTYRIAVDGQAIANLLQRGTARITVNGPPANNGFISAIPLSFGNMVSGLNVGASREAGEQDHCGNDGGASVWYTFTTPTARTVTVDTGLTLMRCVDVWQAANATLPLAPLSQFPLQKVAGALWSTPDDTQTATFSATAGKTYFIAVDGISSEQPPYQAPATGPFTIIVH